MSGDLIHSGYIIVNVRWLDLFRIHYCEYQVTWFIQETLLWMSGDIIHSGYIIVNVRW